MTVRRRGRGFCCLVSLQAQDSLQLRKFCRPFPKTMLAPVPCLLRLHARHHPQLPIQWPFTYSHLPKAQLSQMQGNRLQHPPQPQYQIWGVRHSHQVHNHSHLQLDRAHRDSTGVQGLVKKASLLVSVGYLCSDVHA